MTQTHTPAPWHVIDGIICDNYGQDVLSPVLFDAFPGEHEANARLIAAAPELLEALDNLAEHIDSKSGDFAMRAHFLKEAFAAIAKARGSA